MFDIIKCSADPKSYGFGKFYSYKDSKGKILQSENLQAAVKHKNRRSLIILKDYAFDEGALKLIGEKKKLCFLIDVSELIGKRGISRAILMSKLRNFLRLCVKHGAFYTFASFAEKGLEIRRPDELVHIGMLLGLNRGQMKFSLRMISHYL